VNVVAGPWLVSEFERRLGEALARHTATERTPLDVRCGACDGVGAVLDPDWTDWHARECDARVGFERAHPDGPPWLGSEEFGGVRTYPAALCGGDCRVEGVIVMGVRDFFRRDGDRALYDARAALDANSDRERAAGVTEETDEFLRLNNAVADAEVNASPWARFMR